MLLLLLPFFDDDDDDGLLILLFVVARVDEDGKLVTDDECMKKGKELSILTKWKCCCNNGLCFLCGMTTRYILRRRKDMRLLCCLSLCVCYYEKLFF